MNIKGNLKVLFLNSHYYLKGGSEKVFIEEINLLEAHGHKVIPFSRQSQYDMETEYRRFFPPELDLSGSYSLQSLKNALGIVYSRQTRKCLENLLKQETLHIAHGHNIYAHLTTSVLDALKGRGIPVVVTLHDYKFICPNYHFLDGYRICEDCKTHKYYKAIQNRCVHDNFVYSFLYSIETYFNYLTKRYQSGIDRYLAVSMFIKNKFIEYGFPEDKIDFVPNFINTDDYGLSDHDSRYFLFIGRLSKEKGLETLISAFAELKTKTHRLMIAGDGPLREHLEKTISISNLPNVKLTGFLNTVELNQAIRECTCVILPSECYENAPLSILEAFAHGKPVIGARIGGIPEMIDDGVNGVLFESGNVEDLKNKLELVLSLSEAKMREMGRAARKKAEKEYNAELHYERLMAVYQQAIQEK